MLMIGIGIFILQLWLFASIVCVLHANSSRVGLVPLLFYGAGIVGITNFVELFGFQLEPLPGLIFRPGGQIMVPTILLMVLFIYLVDGTHIARVAMAGIVGINALVLLTLGFIVMYDALNVPDAGGIFSTTGVVTPQFLRGVIASVIAFIADIYIIIVVYQGIHNFTSRLPDGIKGGIAMLMALWTDSVIFNVLFYVGTPSYVQQLPGDLLAKSLSALVLLPLIVYYIERVAPTLPHYQGVDGRTTFDIVRGIVGQLQSTMQELQSELQVSRRTYTRLTENIEEIFWLADASQMQIVYLSPAFRTITGYPPEKFYLTDTSLIDIVHPDDRLMMREGFLAYINDEHEHEFRIQTTDGETRWLRNRSFPIFDNDGSIEQYAGVIEDITEKKAIQEKEFELAVAEERMRVLHDFIRDASHDLKTPLSAITLKVDLINRTTDPARRTQLLAQLKERAAHLADMIDDMFTLSRIEGADSIRMETVDLHSLITPIIETAQPLVHEKKIQLMTELADDTPLPVKGNPDQLSRVIGNLVSNAIRYTDEGTVTVRTRQLDQMLLFSVQDTGIGIDSDEIAHIFERFYRTKNAQQADTAGTGLGLSICKAIVDRHRGIITVESEKGRGSKFTFALPLQNDTPVDVKTSSESR